MADEGPTFQLEVEHRDGYVFFRQSGRVRDVDELARVQAQMKAALVEAGTRLAMFDNRETESPDPMVRASMWTWLSENVSRAALIQAVPKNVKRADERAQRNRVPYRAFQDVDEAEAWLVGSD